MKYKFLQVLVFSFILLNISNAQVVDANKDCVVCTRIKLFDLIRKSSGSKYWPSFGVHDLNIPLIYFTDSANYIAFGNGSIFKNISFRQLACSNNINLYRSSKRLDLIPFHMENRMDLHDPSSPYYFKPVMFCSDVEATIRTVPDFSTTEEWLQLVMHEYFHSFQFSHKKMLKYYAHAITVQEDSLNRLYKNNPWFNEQLKIENKWLLSAISATKKDSTLFYAREFLKQRDARRKTFKTLFGYDISTAENFWEKIEGSARYIEYYTAFTYTDHKNLGWAVCDPLFQQFNSYDVGTDLNTQQNFIVRTQIMAAYYYVTGFNMCRLLDKLNTAYKNELFDMPEKNLFDIVKHDLN